MTQPKVKQIIFGSRYLGGVTLPEAYLIKLWDLVLEVPLQVPLDVKIVRGCNKNDICIKLYQPVMGTT